MSHRVSRAARWIFAGLLMTAALGAFANEPPVADDQRVYTRKDTPVVVQLGGSDGDGPGPYSARITAQPVQGSLTEVGLGRYEYKPKYWYSGFDSFGFKLSDGLADSNTATVDIAVNEEPTASDQSLVLAADAAATLQLAYDDDGFPGPGSIQITRPPAHGGLVPQALGVYLYTPVAGYSGLDEVRWKYHDGAVASPEATYALTVNRLPEARDQDAITLVATPITLTLAAADDGLPGPHAIEFYKLPQHGSLVEQSFGVYLYTPAAGYDGIDYFKWRLDDGAAKSAYATFDLTVNVAPVAEDQEVKTWVDTAASVKLRFTDDGRPGPTSYRLLRLPAHGTLAETVPGTYLYTPAAGWSGYDAFQWLVNDGHVDSNPGTVSVTVNRAPQTYDQEARTVRDLPIAIALDFDDDGIPQPPTFEITLPPEDGTLAATGPGIYTYTPRAGFTGKDYFRWRVNDGWVDSPSAGVTVWVDERAMIGLNPALLDLYQYVDAGPVSGSVVLRNAGVADLAWSAAVAGSEFPLVITPTSGVLVANQAATLTVTADPQSRAAGAYLGTVRFTGANADASPTDLSVNLYLRDSEGGPPDPNEVGAEAVMARDPRQAEARYVRFRPADGEVVRLNPPRFSWPYDPQIVNPLDDFRADSLFTLQIARDPDFADSFEVRDTPYNFYNFLPRLAGASVWYWRVGYDVGTAAETWSAVRRFTLAADAVVWDRFGYAAFLDTPASHPRIFYNTGNLDVVAALRDTDPRSADVWEKMLADADVTLQESWYLDFPEHDCPPGTNPLHVACTYDYFEIGRQLASLAFLSRLTGEPRYAGARSRLLAMASWPPGGKSSPKGLNPDDNKLPNHLTHHLGLFYDWYHEELDAGEAATVRASLEWRIDHIVNNFAWKVTRDGEAYIDFNTLAMIGWSHEFEGVMPAFIGALALYDESATARQALELGLHFLVGVTNSYGEDEAWNEGPGYGSDKMGFLLEAVAALATAAPELQLEKLAVLSDYVEYFSRLTPVGGARHSSFGNRSHDEWDWTKTRLKDAWVVAMLRGDGVAMRNYEESLAYADESGRGLSYNAPWLFYVLPAYGSEPAPVAETDFTHLFPLEGWVTVSSAPPSDRAAQRDAVSMAFAARPQGAYGHSFGSDNAFDLHAFGETLAVGGGSTDNTLEFPRHSMSHNTVLVDGEGQVYTDWGDYSGETPEGFELDLERPERARIIAWKEGQAPNASYTYWAGDAAGAYPLAAGVDRFVRHVVFVDQTWFVIYDDLAAAAGREATYQWLYHIVPATGVPVAFDPGTFTFDYAIGEAGVVVRHLAGTDNLDFYDLVGRDGQVNVAKCGFAPPPGSCAEDYRWEEGDPDAEAVIDAHHLWLMTVEPRPTARFLTVVVPYRVGAEAPPVVEPVAGSERAARVTFRGKRVSISFDPLVAADIVVDADAITFASRVQ